MQYGNSCLLQDSLGMGASSWYLLFQEKAYLYIDLAKVTQKITEHLGSEGCSGSRQCIIIRDYNDIFNDLSGDLFQNDDVKILLGQPVAYTGS